METDLRWHLLASIYHGAALTELLAAACDDGIGIIARWTLREDGGWDVEAMDTEGAGMKPVTEFDEGEPVPPNPPFGAGLFPGIPRKTFAELKEETEPIELRRPAHELIAEARAKRNESI